MENILHQIVDDFSNKTIEIEEVREFLPLIDVEELSPRETRALRELFS